MTLVDGLLMILALMAWVGGMAWEATAERTFLQSWLVWSALITGAVVVFICRIDGSAEGVLGALVLGPTIAFLQKLRHGGWRELFGQARSDGGG